MFYHATVSSEDSVYIIGGKRAIPERWQIEPFFLTSIMQYKDNIWTRVGDLHTARSSHYALASGSIVMIFGGLDGNTQTTE